MLELKSISVKYKKENVLEDISLSLEKGKSSVKKSVRLNLIKRNIMLARPKIKLGAQRLYCALAKQIG